jgi:hypothetical protein
MEDKNHYGGLVLMRGLLKITIHEAVNLPQYQPLTSTTFGRALGHRKYANYCSVYTKVSACRISNKNRDHHHCI